MGTVLIPYYNNKILIAGQINLNNLKCRFFVINLNVNSEYFIIAVTLESKTPLVPFQAGSPIMVSCPTGCGKTYFTHKLLCNNMFTQLVSSILYCYGVYQDYFDQMKISN